jgi:Tol biopolymer transport system component
MEDPLELQDSHPVIKQLDRVLESPVFASSARMQRFLRFIVEARLGGDLAGLKETSVGIAVFDRDPGYDPQTDAIVRVEARRLRSKLQQYYDGIGVLDPLVIQLPTGTYRPEFVKRELPADPITKQLPPALPAPVPPKHRRFAWAAAALLLLAAGVCLGWALSRLSSAGNSQTSVVPLTSYPGQEFDPRISPDGKQLAFVWDGNTGHYNVYTKLLEVGNPVRVTFGDGHDLHPSWSPDGQYLAFLHVAPAEKALMIVPALGGTARKLADLTPSEVGTWRADATQMYGNPGPAWSPTGQYLAVTDYPDAQTGGAITLFTPEGVRLRQLTRPRAGIHDFSPAFSPDGKLLAFIRYTSAYTSDLYFIPVGGGPPRQLTFDHADIRGISWLPDNRTLVFASNRGNGYSVWRTTLDGENPAQIPLNGYRITDPSVSRDGGLLAYTDTLRNSNVWRIRRAGDGHSLSPPEMLIGSSRQSFCAHYSPDGRKIAFLSDRSGSFEVWVARADGSEPVQITSFRGPMAGSPRWSPDGQRLAFDARPEGHAAIFVVSADGGDPRPLEHNTFEERMPSWSGDGKWIYFCSNRGGAVQLWKRPAAGGPPIRLSRRIAFTSSESPDGQTVYFTSLGAGLWQVPAAGGQESQVPELQSFHSGLYVSVAKTGIYFVDQEVSRSILFLSFSTRHVNTIAHMDRAMVIDTSSLDVSSDERNILYSQLDAGGSDVMLARNWSRVN